MTRRIGPRVATCLALILWATVAKGGEVALNYIDPAGADLAISLLRQPEAFAWVGDAVHAPFADATGSAALPPCKARPDQTLPCSLPELTRDVLQALSRNGGLTDNVTALLEANGLVRDEAAQKKILIELDADGNLEHIDFTGVVRGRQEELAAPDATSVFVLRLTRGGGISVVRRTRDSVFDPSISKFTFEN